MSDTNGLDCVDLIRRLQVMLAQVEKERDDAREAGKWVMEQNSKEFDRRRELESDLKRLWFSIPRDAREKHFPDILSRHYFLRAQPERESTT